MLIPSDISGGSGHFPDDSIAQRRTERCVGSHTTRSLGEGESLRRERPGAGAGSFTFTGRFSHDRQTSEFREGLTPGQMPISNRSERSRGA